MINDKKFYAVDNGFLSKISTKINPDKGWLLENVVFNQLEKFGDVYYYSGKKECYLIVSEKQKPVAAIQVCYELNDDNYEREMKG
jgi:predicted AAA+ superfamily ATPase